MPNTRNYQDIFKKEVENIEKQKLYRKFTNIVRDTNNFPIVYLPELNKQVIVWCSNDYLGMGMREEAINEMFKTAKNMGVGSGGTRNLGGNHNPITILEKQMASLHNKEQALVFTSGYVANQTSIYALGKIIPDLKIFSDSENHASIIEGIRFSGCEKFIFEHNNTQHLEEILRTRSFDENKIIIFESLYSMSGNKGKIKEICALAEKYNAMTYIDEVHAIGLYGMHGGGLTEETDTCHLIDIIQGNFGKAFGTIGGYISASELIIESIRHNAPGFIFTTSLPPAIIASTIENVKYLSESNKERIKHQEIVKLTKAKLKENNINFYENDTHIIPIIIGDGQRTRDIYESLLKDHNIYIQYVNYPTVPRGTERLRITPSPLHNEEMINDLVFALKLLL